MRNLAYSCLLFVFFGCKSKKEIPDVSGVKIFLQVERFEKIFFALDTLHLTTSLQQLHQQHPGFTQDFLFNILGTTADSAAKDVPLFLRTYGTMNKEVAEKFKDFTKIEAQIRKGLQFVHYYYQGFVIRLLKSNRPPYHLQDY